MSTAHLFYKQILTTFIARLKISFTSNLGRYCANIKAVKFPKALPP